MKYLLIIITALTLVSSAGAKSRVASCCPGGCCAHIKSCCHR